MEYRIAIIVFLLFMNILELDMRMRSLPDRIAEKMIEKLREEEKRKQEQKPE